MKTNINFSLNHIISPKLDIIDFFKLAKNLNIHNIEIRNDIENL